MIVVELSFLHILSTTDESEMCAVGELKVAGRGAGEVAAATFEAGAEVGVLVDHREECRLKRRVQKTWMQSWRHIMQKPCKCSMLREICTKNNSVVVASLQAKLVRVVYPFLLNPCRQMRSLLDFPCSDSAWFVTACQLCAHTYLVEEHF
jgi:hypothetical protein